MSLKNNINIILIKNRCQLCTKNHTIGIGMILCCSINILMEGYHTPFCIWIGLNRFTNYILMSCTVIVIGIKNDKQYIAIGIIIVCSSICLSLIICTGCTKLAIRIIKMITVVWILRIMVADGGGYWQRTKSCCSQISCIFPFTITISIINLVTRRYHETYIMIRCCLI